MRKLQKSIHPLQSTFYSIRFLEVFNGGNEVNINGRNQCFQHRIPSRSIGKSVGESSRNVRQLFTTVIEGIQSLSHSKSSFAGPLVALDQLQETIGIDSNHKSFELLRSKVNLSEDCLIKAYLKGLNPEMRSNVQMFQPNTIEQCFSIARLYERAYGKSNKIKEEEVFPTQNVVVVECDSIVEQIEDVIDPFSGEERFLEAESSIFETEETKAVFNEKMILKEPLLLDNSWELVKSIKTVEIYDLVHEDESYETIESDVKSFPTPQFQSECIHILEEGDMVGGDGEGDIIGERNQTNQPFINLIRWSIL